MNKPEYIVIHHSLTPDGDVQDWYAIRKFHMVTNGWKDVGYHYGVERYEDDYAIMIGRPEWNVGAHAKEANMNRRSIGICVVGSYDEKPPELAKLHRLAFICKRILRDYPNITDKQVIGHRDVGLMAGYDWRKGEYKSCPGKMFPMDGLRELLKEVEV